MFTGLIEDLGTVLALKRGGNSAVFSIGTRMDTDTFTLGESIAVNGACLTVTAFKSGSFDVDVSYETLNVTALNRLAVGERVHLERAMRADGRLGGHIVQGHVDGVGTIARVEQRAEYRDVFVRLPSELLPEVVPKGSITVDGVSLTVNEIEGGEVRLTIIPHTADETRLGGARKGDIVNIETDVIGKYVRRTLESQLQENTDKGMGRLLARYGYTNEHED